ncbi:unnamed protein product [Allacma fusca]|uniref:Uncharacterized protein n=1 Tax=Allacma fusca TaxID=39272 RepID=A0A8J2JC15_9HEXA|nr:unnamed protein product [Allacma fusca]
MQDANHFLTSVTSALEPCFVTDGNSFCPVDMSSVYTEGVMWMLFLHFYFELYFLALGSCTQSFLRTTQLVPFCLWGFNIEYNPILSKFPEDSNMWTHSRLVDNANFPIVKGYGVIRRAWRIQGGSSGVP